LKKLEHMINTIALKILEILPVVAKKTREKSMLALIVSDNEVAPPILGPFLGFTNLIEAMSIVTEEKNPMLYVFQNLLGPLAKFSECLDIAIKVNGADG
jgi:hypothetical protein